MLNCDVWRVSYTPHTQLCVQVYSGVETTKVWLNAYPLYLTTTNLHGEKEHLFYIHYGPRLEVEDAPIILWTNGAFFNATYPTSRTIVTLNCE